MSFIRAMPTTTDAKMIGASSIRISLMNRSPSGFICAPTSGLKCPSRTPIAMPISTCTYSLERVFLMRIMWVSFFLLQRYAPVKKAASVPVEHDNGELAPIVFPLSPSNPLCNDETACPLHCVADGQAVFSKAARLRRHFLHDLDQI